MRDSNTFYYFMMIQSQSLYRAIDLQNYTFIHNLSPCIYYIYRSVQYQTKEIDDDDYCKSQIGYRLMYRVLVNLKGPLGCFVHEPSYLKSEVYIGVSFLSNQAGSGIYTRYVITIQSIMILWIHFTFSHAFTLSIINMLFGLYIYQLMRVAQVWVISVECCILIEATILQGTIR